MRISRAERRVFGESSELATDPSLRPYLTDMVGAYGLALRDPVFEAAAGHSYGEMAEPLIEAMVDADTPVDLLVLAHGIHDVRLGRSTATYLSSRCPGNPLAFAVCDQGVAAPFSALRAVHAYAVTGGCRRALLLVAEQSALHYEPAGPARVPDRHAAVAFLLEPAAGAAPLDVRQRAVDPGRVREVLAAELAELLPGGGPGATVILGSDLADVADLANLAGLTGLPAIAAADEVVVAPAGQPCTGVWWELAARLPVGDEHGRQVVVAEYDPVLGYLCTTTSPGAGAVPGPAPVGARGAA
ncbi:MAG TPA: hypothetical protein VGD67_04305 [Pseudonocardiaceae bacterium]